MSQYTGKVKFFNDGKGYGFIVPDQDHVNNGGDVFVHLKSLEVCGMSTLKTGAPVSFQIEEYGEKSRATNIKLIG